MILSATVDNDSEPSLLSKHILVVGNMNKAADTREPVFVVCFVIAWGVLLSFSWCWISKPLPRKWWAITLLHPRPNAKSFVLTFLIKLSKYPGVWVFPVIDSNPVSH